MFPQIFGKYVLERELASGGMAIIYLATLRGAGGFEKRLVLKQIKAELASDEAFVARFVAEAKTTVELSHPNIVPVYELGVEQGVYFIAMELAQGVTLSDLLHDSGALSPEEGAYLGVEICRALDYAHRKAGVVHRDVTPRNVLIDEEGAVRLIDFGIAAPVSVPGTARERVFGSPGHMPLEQLRGGRLTPATDVFAVAALLVEGWTGAAPFRRATKELSDAALEEAPPRVSIAVPALASLDVLVERALAKDAADRPATAEEFARPLREFLRTADLGDIARRLGARVKRARRSSLAELARSGPPLTPATPVRASSSGPSTPHTAARASTSGASEASGTPATPHAPQTRHTPGAPLTRPVMQSVTETFATRADVVEWTRASSRPAPLLDEEPVLPDAPAASSAPPPDLPPPPRPPRRGRFWSFAGALAAAVAAGGLVSLLGAPDPVVPPEEIGAPRKDSTPRATATEGLGRAEPTGSGAGEVEGVRARVAQGDGTGGVGAPSASGAAPGGQGASTKAGVGGTAGTVAPPPSASSQQASSQQAALLLTSDLPAGVTVDGVGVGTTPVRLRKPPGPHAVSFASLSLDERVATTVTLEAGKTVAVHAEFTRAVPTFRIR